ncbi:MAG: hypothetical protein ACRC7O_09670, partial [Fimbriiglobus sp.]
LPLAAEAQSTLRSAIADARQDWTDPDQIHLFVHIKEATKRERVYVSRFLRQEDWARAEDWAGVVARIEKLAPDIRATGRQDRNRGKDLSNLAYKSRKLSDPANDDPDEWARVIELTAGLVDRGLPPSNTDLRDALLPLFDRLADWPDLPVSVERVLQEIERFVASRPAAVPDPDREPHWSAEVTEVAEFLRGTEMVLIGGQVRPDRRAALMTAFGLTNLDWVTTPEHTSTSFFEPHIARPGVVVVLLATRWANHDYQNVKDYCETHGKLYVKLPAGYHPNQVAHQVLEQVGKRLRAARSVAG